MLTPSTNGGTGAIANQEVGARNEETKRKKEGQQRWWKVVESGGGRRGVRRGCVSEILIPLLQRFVL